MSEEALFMPSDTFKMVTATRLRLHPRDDVAAIVYRSSADRGTHVTTLNWVRGVDAGEFEIVWDPLQGVDDFQWSPTGERFLVVRRSGGKTVFSVGDWRGPSSVDRALREFVLPEPPESISWSADGRRVAFCARVRQEDVDGAALVGGETDGVVFFRELIPFKHERADYWGGMWYQLFVLQEVERGRWEMEQLTSDGFDHLMPSLSPDGRSLAYVRPSHGEDRHWGNQALMALDLEDRETRVVSEMGGWYWHPTWAPSGGGLAWLGHDSRRGKGEAMDTHLWVKLGEAAPRDVTPPLERTVEDVMLDDCNVRGTWPLVWSDDERELYGVVTDGGRTSLFRFPVDGSGPDVVIGGDRRVYTFAHARGGFLFGVGSPQDPCQVRHFRDGVERVVARPNASWLDQRKLSEPRSFSYAGARGDTIEGWLIPPIGRGLEGAPLVMQLNRGRWGWSFYLESQILASQGFAVAFVNPHGSYGYGETFRNATHYEPATLEMEDFLLGLDHLIELGVDAGRVGINGTSFGGFSVNWLSSRHSDRFRAGVAQASYCNRHNLWGSSSIGPSRWDHPGPSWRHADFLLEKSPISYVEGVDIPLLLIHGERDTICPLEQAEQWFTALTIAGKRPSWIILRDEGHDLARTARPASRQVRITAIVNWFRQHLQDRPPIGAPRGSATASQAQGSP